MDTPPFQVEKQLHGWVLFWAHLELQQAEEKQLAGLRHEVALGVRKRFASLKLTDHPTVVALRRLFRAAGCDPTRYRPASEALVRRLLKGDELPAIHPLVDVNNCLSAELTAPCCVMAEGSFTPPLLFRSGRAGEGYESLRGPFNLEGKPLLCDTQGPLDAPITGNERVKVLSDTNRAWLVCYLPEEPVDLQVAASTLEDIAQRASGILVSAVSAT